MYSVSRDIMLLFALLQIIALNVLCYSKTAVKVWKSEKGGARCQYVYTVQSACSETTDIHCNMT